MKTFLLFAAMAFSISIASGQEYLISYTGSGQSSTVASVLVVNLSSGDSLLMNGSDTLLLTSTVGIRSFGSNNEVLSIFPNPMGRSGRIDFYSSRSGNTAVEVFEVTGKCILQHHEKLAGGSHSFEIGGLKSGIYFVKVSTSENLLTGRFIATGANGSNPFINYAGHSNDAGSTGRLKSAKSIIEMYFIEGERLLFKGISGNYARVLTLVPVENTTIEFNFVECQDADNNPYPVVSIGNKDWMAENLKTTTYNDGTPIEYPGAEVSLWEEDSVGAYAWWDNNPLWKDKYGALYNWYAVKNEKEICPDGWQLPNDTLWALLAYNLGGEILGGGKIKSTRTEPDPHPRWKSPNVSSTNESGFSALPASYRFNFGTYGDLGSNAAWWSSSENTDDDAWYRSLNYYDGVFLRSSGHKNSGYAVRCIKAEDAQVTLPTLTTYEIYNITAIFGMTGGNITSDGGAPVTARGVCWSTNPNPTTGDFYTIDGEGTGSFISSMHDLMHGTTYYVRAYAINITGTAYGNEQQFTTAGAPCPDAPTVTDIDGNVYNTVQIGTQCWMKENLKTTKYRNGVSIDYPGDNAASWINNTTGAYAWYNNDISWKHIYGALYNGYAVGNSYGICPEGWHVPSNNDWNTLFNYTTGGTSTGASQLKSCRQINTPIGFGCDTDNHPRWNEHNTYFGTENYGFSAFPAGRRDHNTAQFSSIGTRAFLWSSSSSYFGKNYYYFRYDNSSVNQDNGGGDNNAGFVIRCLKDNY